MIRPLYSFLLLFIVLLSGCSEASSSDTVPKEKSYVSVYEYFDEFTGENLKTSVLQITKNDNSVELTLRILLSDHLKEKMMHTEKPIYFTFADLPGNETIKNLLVETPSLVQIELNSKENRYTISQRLKLKENVTEADNQALLSPASYRFQVINEEKLSVASFMGLEYSLLPEDNPK
ncbi:hypothetical protein [Brevibacillus parabrevis]|uniref:hypothetical protein n=1 Tax=Brevibacillus parabrevis TaxID=54914 RepID=UPI0011373505|nr:hypothetical protein [Brevibacillus parabrevis]TGV28021.1 hypothetical protein EN829_042605 [Mesorhizobium sp. M00.F.Ca.ET.186.01.1.1]